MTDRPRLTWTWAGLAASALTFGVIGAAGMLLAYQLRSGQDGDLLALGSPGLADFGFMAILLGILGSPLVCVGWWLARKMGRARRAFLILTPGLAVITLVGWKAYAHLRWSSADVISGAEGLQMDRLLYLPPYLEVLTVGVAMFVAVHTYSAVAKGKVESR